MDYEITQESNILKKNGELNVKGWSKKMVFNYNIDDTTANMFHIKAGDFYFITNDKCSVCLEIRDYRKFKIYSATLVDYKRGIVHSNYVKRKFTVSKSDIPLTSSYGDISYSCKNLGMRFSKVSNNRYIRCDFVNFDDAKNLYVAIKLRETSDDTIVMVKPGADNNKYMLYNQKIPCMSANGVIKYGGIDYKFKECSSFAILDWNREIAQKRKSSAWCAASGKSGNTMVGFIADYNKDDEINPNMIFVDGTGYKINKVYLANTDDKKEWKLISEDGKLNVTFDALESNKIKIRHTFLSSNIKRIFGRFHGKLTLDSGKVIEIKDIMGFIETCNSNL